MRKEDFFVNENKQIFIWNGVLFDGIPAAIDWKRRTFSSIITEQSSQNLRCWADDFGKNAPEIGDKISDKNGEQWRILGVHKSPPFLVFALGGEYGRS